MVPNCIPKSKRVEDVLPIGAPEDERTPVRQLILNERMRAGEPRIEVNVLNTPNVVRLVDVYSDV